MGEMGRPEYWTEERRKETLERIYASVASGTSLSRTLQDEPDMPSPREFWRWHMADEDIRNNLARARENGVEAHLEAALDIAEDGTNDWMEKRSEKDDTLIGWRVNGEAIQRSKLRVETLIKRAQMIAPRKYGPKLDLTTGGDKIGNPADAAPSIASLLAEAEKRKDARTKT